MFGGYAAVWALSSIITLTGFDPLIQGLESPGALSGSGLVPDFYAGFAAFLTTAGPRRMRSAVKWSWNALYALGVLLVVLSWNSVPGVVLSFAVGRIVGMVIRFAVGTRNQGAWGTQVVQSLQGIGLDVRSLTRRPEAHAESGMLKTTLDDDLAENSRVYDMVDGQGRRYTVSVIDGQEHNAGYLNQLWQWLRLTGVTMRRDRSVSDAVHHHLTMLLSLDNIGLAASRPYGIADCGNPRCSCSTPSPPPCHATSTRSPTTTPSRSCDTSTWPIGMGCRIIASPRTPWPACRSAPLSSRDGRTAIAPAQARTFRSTRCSCLS